MYFDILNRVGMTHGPRVWQTDRQTDRTASSNSAR